MIVMFREKVLSMVRGLRPLLMSEWGTAQVVEEKGSHPADVVTRIDKAVERALASGLKIISPDIPFVGEEFGGDRNKERFWLADPIDGTGHYTRGLPFCTTMLALIVNNEVVFSAIYDFIKDEIYWAERGVGAYVNQRRLYVSDRPLCKAYISAEINPHTESNVALFRRLEEKSAILTTICAGWEYAMVASGKLDARITYDPFGQDYDYAPGSLLVREAGGVVNNIYCGGYDYTNLSFIAANPVIYQELTQGSDSIFPRVQVLRGW